MATVYRDLFVQYILILRFQFFHLIVSFFSVIQYFFNFFILNFFIFVFKNSDIMTYMTHHAFLAKIAIAQLAITCNFLRYVLTVNVRLLLNKFCVAYLFLMAILKNLIILQMVFKINFIFFFALNAEYYFPSSTFITGS